MSQSGFIAAMLLAAFILWLAINQRLTAYTAVLFGPTQKPTPQGNISTNNGVIAPAASGPGVSAGVDAAGALADQSGIIDTTASVVDEFGSIGSDIAGLLEFLP